MYRLFLLLLSVFIMFQSGSSLAQLSGAYTIGSGGSYASFTAAVSALSSQGVSGAVTFNVITGSYNEQIEIPAISGAGAANNITFQAQSGNAANVTLSYSASTSPANYVVRLNGASYINFNNLTLAALGTSYGIVFDLANSSQHINITNSVLNGGGTNGANHSLVYSYNTVVNNIVVQNSTLNSGYYGIYLGGLNTTSLSNANQVQNCTFNNQGTYSIYLSYQDSPVINQNVITGSPGYGMYLYYCNDELKITSNRVSASSYGIYLYSCTGGTGIGTARGLIANNFITTGTGSNQGLYLYNDTNQDVYYNSIHIQSNSTSSSAMYFYAGGTNNVRNNNLLHSGYGYALYIYSPSALSVSDYNNLFSNGNYVGNWNNVNQYDLASYRTASGMEANSVSVYPNFTSESDLHTLGAWLNGKGNALGSVTTDLDGETRHASTPDIGADEFTPAVGTTTPLAGTYTVGGSSPDYATVGEAIDDLLLKGVSDSVSLEIRNGTYNVHEVLYTVPGSAANRPVIFRSESGNRDNVTLYYTAGGSSDNYVLYLEGADFVRLKDLGFAGNTANNATYSTCLYLTGGVQDFYLVDCKLSGPSSSSGNATLYYASNALSSSRRLQGNLFSYGSYGISQSGASGSEPNSGTLIEGNQFDNQYSYGAYLLYEKDLKVRNNVVNNSPSYGFYLQSCSDALEVTANRVSGSNYGIYLYSCTGGTGIGTARGLVANNFITTGTGSNQGLYLYNDTNQDVYYNSIHIQSNSTSSSAMYFYAGGTNNVRNNNLLHSGYGYALYIYSPSALSVSDYNNLFSNGNYVGNWNNVNQYDLASYRTASGMEANSVSVYPNFTSESDLHTLGAWLNGKGNALGSVTTDLDGETRHASTPDIGADEFTPAVGTTTPLAGTYTVGGSSPDYATVGEAIDDLLLKGVSDSVSLEIRNGTYNVHEVLYTVPGSAANRPVIFRSESGNRDNVTLYYTAGGSSDNYVLYLEGADFVRLNDLGFAGNTANNATYSTCLYLTGGVQDFYLVDCKLSGPSSSSGNATLYYASNALSSSRRLQGNLFSYGSYGISQSGASGSEPNSGTLIEGNQFDNQYSYGAYLLYEKDLKVRNNVVNNSPSYGLYLQSCSDALEVTSNRVSASNYGIYLYSCTGGTGIGTARGLVANNFITTGTGSNQGLYLYNDTNQDVYYNSIHIQSNSTSSSAMYFYAGGTNNVRNNNLMHSGYGYALYIYSPSALSVSDYNNLFSNGNYVGNWNNVNQYDLASYRTASGMEAHSVSVYPNFTSESDLHTLGAWLNGKGNAVGSVTTDLDGETRHASTPDIGADEFTPAVGTTTPLAGTYTVGGSSPDYATVGEAIDDLLLKGISDSVSLEIRNGTYNVHEVLYTVPGSAANRPVIFRSESGNRDNVTLYYTAGGSSDNYVLYLEGADFVRLNDWVLPGIRPTMPPTVRVYT